MLYAATFLGSSVDVIDPGTNVAVESVPIGEGAVSVAADARTGDVYVTHGNAVSVLRARPG
jgi:DNA-binding beta-propeller fold protein YncE